MRHFAARIVLLATVMLMAAISLGVEGKAGQFRFSLVSDPNVVPVGKAKLTVKVTDADGKPVTGATVKVLAKMPGMNMGEREEVAVPTGEPGAYRAPATFAMAGAYEVSVSVSSPTGNGQGVVPLATGKPSADSSPSLRPWLWAAGLMGAVGFVMWRMKATGQSIGIRSLFQKNALVSLGVLAISLVAGTWAVRNLRREGAMTPLEAQVMEMNTPAPEGALPVTVAEVKAEPFEATVSYSGQVIGFVEQEVVPRVSGTIVAMPVYVGDKVKRGQLLAKLDTSQIDPMVAEKAAGVNNAAQGVSVAQAEIQQATNMVEQARAEAAMAETEVAEATSMLASAKAARASTSSGVEASAAERRSAKADVDAAVADLDYQSQELERMRQLFAKGAVSKDEWQTAVAASQRANAAATSARERLAKADSMLSAARSELTRADSEVMAANARVAKSEANHRAKLTQVKTAQSGVQSARARMGQSRAAVSEASAGLRGATTQQRYAELRAEVDGVIMQRLVSPGVVVVPGQAVLKVAQVSPVRLQANVPQQDLAKISVGARVHVLDGEDGSKAVEVQVSSVAPSVDPASRLGVVEAIYANRDRRFSPGQYVSLEIGIGSSSNALVVPADAVVTATHNGSTESSVWTVVADGAGRTVAALRQVEIMGRALGKVAIRTGLRAGDRVIVAPFGLAEGMSVEVAAKPVASNGDTVTIEITSAGYSPPSVQIPAGKPITLVFIRRVEETCATEVDFPELGIHAETPLNKPAKILIPPQSAGKELKFACPMDMVKGKVVVR